jgi:hypothetical protein
MLELLMFADTHLEETVEELQIFTDATHTNKVARGVEKCTQEPHLAKQLQNLYRELQKLIKISIFHVNGHTGDVGHEVANEYAGRARKGRYLHLPEDYLYSPVHELHVPMNVQAPDQDQHFVWQIVRAHRQSTMEDQRHQCAKDMGEVLLKATLQRNISVTDIVNIMKRPYHL